MRKTLLILAMATTAGCGVDTMTAAATGAAMKKQELEQGKKTMARVEQQLDQAMQKAQQARKAGEEQL